MADASAALLAVSAATAALNGLRLERLRERLRCRGLRLLRLLRRRRLVVGHEL